MEKETLEEAAKNKYLIENTGTMFMPNSHEVTNIYRQEGFIAGAKWQAERMYSEEEVKKAIKLAIYSERNNNEYDNKYINPMLENYIIKEIKKK